jgi:L-alanine-DL-glutamate epimerase-like enolase superfamily enzyme
MKITSISRRVVNAEMRNWVFVKVETDVAGLFGWGEATLEWKTRAVVGAVEDLAPLLIGRDPRDIEQAVRVMKKHSFWRLGVIGMSALSGIEIALWDILGKHLGVPVWRLLGGKVRDKVKVYTHLGLGDMRAVYESARDGAPGRARARGRGEGLPRLQGGVHPLHAPPRARGRGDEGGAHDGGAARGGRAGGRDHGRFSRPRCDGLRRARLYRGAGAGPADVRRRSSRPATRKA